MDKKLKYIIDCDYTEEEAIEKWLKMHNDSIKKYVVRLAPDMDEFIMALLKKGVEKESLIKIFLPLYKAVPTLVMLQYADIRLQARMIKKLKNSREEIINYLAQYRIETNVEITDELLKAGNNNKLQILLWSLGYDYVSSVNKDILYAQLSIEEKIKLFECSSLNAIALKDNLSIMKGEFDWKTELLEQTIKHDYYRVDYHILEVVIDAVDDPRAYVAKLELYHPNIRDGLIKSRIEEKLCKREAEIEKHKLSGTLTSDVSRTTYKL